MLRPRTLGNMAGITDQLSTVLEERTADIRRALDAPERTPRMAVIVGRVLGVGFVVCFLTGLYSHLLQNPIPGLTLPTRPVELYAWTQGTHVAVGTALVPLLLAKLWIVYPRLFQWPPVRSVVDVLERGSIAVLVSTALLQVTMGVLNTFQWYPWPFSFRSVHWGLSWVLIGALSVHLAVKLPLIMRHWRRARGASDD